MSVRKPVARDEYDLLLQRIKELERKVEFLLNQKHPSVPIYDSTNFPQDPFEGQIAIAPIV